MSARTFSFDTGLPLLVAALESSFCLTDCLSSVDLANLRATRGVLFARTGPAWRERVAASLAPKPDGL